MDISNDSTASPNSNKPIGNGSVVENGGCPTSSPEKREEHPSSNITAPAKPPEHQPLKKRQAQKSNSSKVFSFVTFCSI
ncbi:hypothetical protein WMY93_005247 [Mugilogobius chulae]|uniref:Uncharacterized protein n=1 Tax=Mugilogobius chulae TaxID=88201 RepID=A0AAW0PUC6_9GOBI